MNLHSPPLLFALFIALTTFVLPTLCVADESTTLPSPQSSGENLTSPSAESVGNASGVTTKTPLKSTPTLMLLAQSIQFKNAAGTPGYYKESYDHHCHAARSSDASSQFALGWLYVNGRGIPKDESMAAFLFTKAAEQGHAHAQEWLTKMAANSSQPNLPACLLPDPPPPAISTASFNPMQNEPLETLPFYPKGGPIFNLVNKLAPRYQIDIDLAMAFIAVESGFNPNATSPKNAQGLMQLIPETAKRFRVKNAYNAEDNIKGGLAYLQWLLAFFQGNVELVAAAYNSGEKTVEKYKGVPPYPETQNYVQRIAVLYKKPSHPFRSDLIKTSFIPGAPLIKP